MCGNQLSPFNIIPIPGYLLTVVCVCVWGGASVPHWCNLTLSISRLCVDQLQVVQSYLHTHKTHQQKVHVNVIHNKSPGCAGVRSNLGAGTIKNNTKSN